MTTFGCLHHQSHRVSIVECPSSAIILHYPYSCITCILFQVLGWAVASIILGGACYFTMATFGCLQSTQYGVAVQVFGNCKDNNLQCLCLRYKISVYVFDNKIFD